MTKNLQNTQVIGGLPKIDDSYHKKVAFFHFRIVKGVLMETEEVF
tara:strand:+ start:2223 stop:2357 length:135 start_codon:yes stop_codon:yes gene_type:complete